MSTLARQIPEVVSKLEKTLTLEERNTFIACSIARALSLELQLPSSPVAVPEQHFFDAHGALLGERISAINEAYVIDTDYIYDLTRQFYLLRYSLVFDTRDVSRVFSCAAVQAPDKIPAIAVTSLQKFNTPEAEDAFNMIVWGARRDGGASSVL